jgi:hypothetical protein
MLLIIILSLSARAENPPESYQKFKVEFKNMPTETVKRWTPKQKAILGVSVGAAAFIVTEVFFYAGDFENYHKSILIGAGVHIVTHIILQATSNRDKYSCY